jgi:hypothetical protein
MPLQYTTHARERMEDRNFTEEQVEMVLRRHIGDPDPGNRPDTIVYRGLIGTRRVGIVVDAYDANRVITVLG